MAKKADRDPIFSRGEVARILNVTTATIANRESSGKYPDPRRDLNNYRIYSLQDVMNLQLLTYGAIDTRPLLSIMYDQGFQNHVEAAQIIDKALSRRKGTA